MPIINPAPDAPRPPEPDANEVVEIKGKRYLQQEIDDIMAYLQAQGAVVRVPNMRAEVMRLARDCGALVTAVAANDADGIIDNTGQVLGSTAKACGIVPMVNANTEGAPAHGGAVEATLVTAAVLSGNPAMREITQADPEQMKRDAWACKVSFGIKVVLEKSQKHYTNYSAPKSRYMIDGVRTVAKTIKPQVETDLNLALQMDPVYTYLEEPYDRGIITRRKGEARDDNTERRTEERVVAKARTDARAEAAEAMSDAARVLFLKDK